MLPVMLNQRFLTGVVREYPTIPFIGEQFLPMQPVPGLETMWDVIMKDAKIAPYVAIDGESELADKAGMKRVFNELTDTRIKEALNETDLLGIRMPGEPEVVTGLAATQRATAEMYVRRTSDRMAARVWGRVEQARWECLSTGGIVYTSAKVNFNVDFGFKAEHKLSYTGTSQWSDTTNADPLTDINNAIALLRKQGYRPRRMVVGANIPGYLLNNAKIRDLLKNQNVLVQALNFDTILTMVGQLVGLTIEVYDAQYQAADDTDTYFLDADTYVLMIGPSTGDGESLGDVATGPAKANNWDTGIYAWAKEEEDPWVTYVGAGIHAFPRIRHPYWIICCDTCGGAG